MYSNDHDINLVHDVAICTSLKRLVSPRCCNSLNPKTSIINRLYYLWAEGHHWISLFTPKSFLVVRIRHQLTPQVVEPGQKIMTKLWGGSFHNPNHCRWLEQDSHLHPTLLGQTNQFHSFPQVFMKNMPSPFSVWPVRYIPLLITGCSHR